MSSIIEGYNYDIFISYRQKDNRHDGWVTEFVDNLKGELESTFKEEISVYFDINLQDGLLETHDVDESLKEKLKCLIFIPIISRTYCDPKSFAWEHEFKAFVAMASKDKFGLKVKLPNGNVASRVLPIRIHDLEQDDIKECENIVGGFLRGIEFIYNEPGVNRPLKPDDDENINLNRSKYRNQINKTANAIRDIISGLKAETRVPRDKNNQDILRPEKTPKWKIVINSGKSRTIRLTAIIAITVIAILFFFYDIISPVDTIKRLRSSGKISILVLPFQNLTGDNKYDVSEVMIQNNLINILSDTKELQVRLPETINAYFRDNNQYSLNTAAYRKIARKLDVDVIVNGSINTAGDIIRITSKLIDPEAGRIIKPFTADFKTNVSDSLYRKIRDYLLISILEKDAPSDFRDFKMTDSPEAYKFLKLGQQANWDGDFVQAVKYSKMAVDSDSTYIAAIFRLALSYYNLGSEDPMAYIEAKKWIKKIYDKRYTLPAIGQIWVEYTHALCFDTPYKAVECGKNIVKLDDQLPFGHYIQAHNYGRIHMYDKAAEEYEAALKIYYKWKTKPAWSANYIGLGDAYHKLNRYREESKLYKKAEKDFPDDDGLKFNEAILALSSGKFDAAGKYLEEFENILRRKSIPESRISKLSGDIYLEAGLSDKAEEYYRKSYDEDEQSLSSKNTLAYFLINSDRDIDEGIRLAGECLSSDPDHYDYLHTKGLGLFKKSKYNEALDLLQKSWNLRMEKATYDHTAWLNLEAAKKAKQ